MRPSSRPLLIALAGAALLSGALGLRVGSAPRTFDPVAVELPASEPALRPAPPLGEPERSRIAMEAEAHAPTTAVAAIPDPIPDLGEDLERALQSDDPEELWNLAEAWDRSEGIDLRREAQEGR